MVAATEAAAAAAAAAAVAMAVAVAAAAAALQVAAAVVVVVVAAAGDVAMPNRAEVVGTHWRLLRPRRVEVLLPEAQLRLLRARARVATWCHSLALTQTWWQTY